MLKNESKDAISSQLEQFRKMLDDYNKKILIMNNNFLELVDCKKYI